MSALGECAWWRVCMADLLFILVTLVSFGVLIAFAYACDRL
jgi:hypothetical protein